MSVNLPSLVQVGDMPARPSAGVSTADSQGELVCIDFACLVKKQLIVCGWIWDFAHSNGAFIYIGHATVDLTQQAIQLPRSDVTEHFLPNLGHDEHGFYVLIEMPEQVAADKLCLSVSRHGAKAIETFWPVACYDSVPQSMLQAYLGTFNNLLSVLPANEARRLLEFLAPTPAVEYSTMLPQTVRFEVDLCCILETKILIVVGWLLDPACEVSEVRLLIGEKEFQFFSDCLWIARPDIMPEPPLSNGCCVTRPPGFVFVQAVPSLERCNAQFLISVGTEVVRLSRDISAARSEGRRDFLSLLSKMDPDSALTLNQQVAGLLDNSADHKHFHSLLQLNHRETVHRLPTSLQNSSPRYALFVDHAIPVAQKGLFLVGWFNAEPQESLKVVCHSGPLSYTVSEDWSRHQRADVTSHLRRQKIQLSDYEHGYSCYVPLRSADSPYILSVVSQSGEIRRMGLPVFDQVESAIETVRALLTFDSDRTNLGLLLDRHVGPAVWEVWAGRSQCLRKTVLSSYGPKPRNPAASIIIPLYGRHDLAEYQMALFADDPELQGVEVIYVVDDPAIFDEFLGLSPELYAIYRVPFVLAFAGANLGYAGANNFGADVARGRYLILMNSDVMPKGSGWVGDLLKIYKSLSRPGILGVKLLYEDGSVQHAGIVFRRNPAWGNMWINDHPHKGQSPQGLRGVREVGAVTTACALIEASLYRELGGFCEDYIVGDFEDSDLCLRASSAGRLNQIALDIELYHLERQSQNRTGDAMWRRNLTAYNCWLHNRRWADSIGKNTMSLEASPA